LQTNVIRKNTITRLTSQTKLLNTESRNVQLSALNPNHKKICVEYKGVSVMAHICSHLEKFFHFYHVLIINCFMSCHVHDQIEYRLKVVIRWCESEMHMLNTHILINCIPYPINSRFIYKYYMVI
jgi:hypothetical protein